MVKGVIIVPCFNEAENITLFYDEICKIILKYELELNIIFLNDGSTDKTLNILKELNSSYDNVSFLDFKKNYGKNTILIKALKYCIDYDFTILMDVDLQHNPIYIKDYINKWKKYKFEMVIGRRGKFKETKIVKLLKKIYFKMSFLNQELETYSDYRLLDKSIVEKIVYNDSRPPFLRHYLDSLKTNSELIEINIPDRKIGKSKFSIFKLITIGLESYIFLRIKGKIILMIYFIFLLLSLSADKDLKFYIINFVFILMAIFKLKSYYLIKFSKYVFIR